VFFDKLLILSYLIILEFSQHSGSNLFNSFFLKPKGRFESLKYLKCLNILLEFIGLLLGFICDRDHTGRFRFRWVEYVLDVLVNLILCDFLFDTFACE
jgi:hypothetical protein